MVTSASAPREQKLPALGGLSQLRLCLLKYRVKNASFSLLILNFGSHAVPFLFLSVGQIYLNHAFALDSAWLQPEEPRLFQGAEKPVLLSNQVAMAVARPAAASRPLPTLVLAPQLIPGK